MAVRGAPATRKTIALKGLSIKILTRSGLRLELHKKTIHKDET